MPSQTTLACLALATTALFLLPTPTLAQPSFHPMGPLDPQGSIRTANAVSSDGSFIVGRTVRPDATGSHGEAYRWSASSGLQAFGDLPGPAANSTAYAISWDGSVVVGMGRNHTQPFRWTQASGIQPMAGLSAGSSTVTGLSGDGNFAVGVSNGAGMRWSLTNGVEPLGALTPSGFSQGLGANQNGSVVVGMASPGGSGNLVAFRWTQQGGMTSLGDFDGGDLNSWAWATSANGSVVVGHGSILAGSTVPFRWTQATGLVRLGTENGKALSVSADGNSIVGTWDSSTSRAFYWNPDTGAVDLHDYLSSLGLDMQGWELSSAQAISADARVIVGEGRSPQGQRQGWYAVIPSPGTMPMCAAFALAWARRRRHS